MRDVEALGEVYDLYAGVVFGVALTVTADRGVAEEVTRQVFLDLWRRPGRFDPDQGPLRPWLATLAHRRGVAAIRERAATRRRDERAARDDELVIDVDEAVQSVLNTEKGRAALAALPDDERSPIRLAYFGGKTYREVAIDLAIEEDTVKSRMYSGLRRMADSSSLHGEPVGPETNRGP